MGVKEMKREKFDKTQQTETKGIEIKRQYNNLPSKSRDTHQRQNRANSVSPLNNNESVIFLCKSFVRNSISKHTHIIDVFPLLLPFASAFTSAKRIHHSTK